MAFWEAVVFIVAIGAVVSIVRARSGITTNRDGSESVQRSDTEVARLTHETAQLKERIAVLERLATDEHGPRALDREIEKLR